MKIAGQWVGLGIGDVGDEVAKLRVFMARKFSYAKGLVGAGVPQPRLFDSAMSEAVALMQANYVDQKKLKLGTFSSGIVNAETKYTMGYEPRPKPADTRGVLVTVCGTGVPWWVGPDADVARAVESKWKWRPVAYPAAAVPMGRSIAAGRAEARRIINEERQQIERYGLALIGYSQGAIVTAELYEYDIKPVNGSLHWALKHIRKAVTFGGPMREMGRAWDDGSGSVAGPDTSGVTPQRMVDTPDWWRDYAHRGDFYTEVADDEAAENKRAIWALVRGQDVLKGPDSLLMQAAELLGVVSDASQIAELFGVIKAIYDTGMFFIKRTTPHTNYRTEAAINYLLAV